MTKIPIAEKDKNLVPQPECSQKQVNQGPVTRSKAKEMAKNAHENAQMNIALKNGAQEIGSQGAQNNGAHKLTNGAQNNGAQKFGANGAQNNGAHKFNATNAQLSRQNLKPKQIQTK